MVKFKGRALACSRGLALVSTPERCLAIPARGKVSCIFVTELRAQVAVTVILGGYPGNDRPVPPSCCGLRQGGLWGSGAVWEPL